MKTISFTLLLTTTMMISAIGCEQSSSGPSNNEMSAQNITIPEENFAMMHAVVDTIAADSLSVEEEQGLTVMREEEKLARDVYSALYEVWKLRPFSNITRSEQIHTTSVLTLLNRYSVTDPVGANGPGVFIDPVLQKLYNDLMVQGNISAIDALTVGAIIEEVDIADLQHHIKASDNADILYVYANLMRGSRNHLRAFVGNLRVRGITYAPQYLTKTEFDEIIAGSMERGCGTNGSN
jgi:hypothetical protein